VPFAGPRNPVDITGQATSEPELLDFAAQHILAERQHGSLLVFLAAAGSSDALWPHFKAFAGNLRRDHPDVPLALCALFAPERRRELEALGCMVFSDPSAAVRTMGAISGIGAGSAPAPAEQAGGPAVRLPAGPLSEAAALTVLRHAGLPAMPFEIVQSPESAVAAARRLGYPVVLKIVSVDILHKSDIGGVCLRLADDEAVSQAYQAVTDAARSHAPDARIEGAMVAPMIGGGVECILGVQRDPVFGPIVMLGLGGIFVETLRDVSFRLAPFGRDEAMGMVDELKAKSLLFGARGRPVADVDALANALVKLSKLAVQLADQVDSIDINPFSVLPQGQGAVALDAVLIRRADAD
jgi:acyl-CoA synthetase (NDP forming)